MKTLKEAKTKYAVIELYLVEQGNTKCLGRGLKSKFDEYKNCEVIKIINDASALLTTMYIKRNAR